MALIAAITGLPERVYFPIGVSTSHAFQGKFLLMQVWRGQMYSYLTRIGPISQEPKPILEL